MTRCSSLVAALTVNPSSLWQSKAPKGFNYKDKTGAQHGVQKAQLKTAGTDGKSKVQLKGKGSGLLLPTPLSALEFFDQDPTLIVQLVNDETTTCWQSTFTSNLKNSAEQFKAKLQ